MILLCTFEQLDMPKFFYYAHLCIPLYPRGYYFGRSDSAFFTNQVQLYAAQGWLLIGFQLEL
jgi:hypothetical protein